MKQFKLRPAVAAVAVLGVLAPVQQASAAQIGLRRPAAIDFLPATLVPTQNGRVNVVNLASEPKLGRGQAPPDPCKGQIHFYDAAGNAVGDAQGFELAPGQSTSIAALVPALMPGTTDATGDGSVRQLRARVLLPAVQVPPDPCRAVRGLFEVYSTDTLETRFTSPGVIRGFNPQPDPPGDN
jgi:hypothetical protein